MEREPKVQLHPLKIQCLYANQAVDYSSIVFDNQVNLEISIIVNKYVDNYDNGRIHIKTF